MRRNKCLFISCLNTCYKYFYSEHIDIKFLIMDKMIDFEWFTSNNLKKQP